MMRRFLHGERQRSRCLHEPVPRVALDFFLVHPVGPFYCFHLSRPVPTAASPASAGSRSAAFSRSIRRRKRASRDAGACKTARPAVTRERNDSNLLLPGPTRDARAGVGAPVSSTPMKNETRPRRAKNGRARETLTNDALLPLSGGRRAACSRFPQRPDHLSRAPHVESRAPLSRM